MKVVVYHTSYGCDTGCCGHVVEVDDKRIGGFEFMHPWLTGRMNPDDPREWAEQLVREACAEDGITNIDEHVANLDWDNCIILED